MLRFTCSLFRAPSGLIGVALLFAVSALAASREAQFLAENNAAMAKMMAAMDVKPSGDVDADFVATMVPARRDCSRWASAERRRT
jgi:hypothetical protein